VARRERQYATKNMARNNFYALCSGRELIINLQCQANKRNLLVVPGKLTRVKQRGAAAGYMYSISEVAI
jgi:hypothetical protein